MSVRCLNCGCESLVFVIQNGYTLPPFDQCRFSFQSWRLGSCKTLLLRPFLREVARGCFASRPGQSNLHRSREPFLFEAILDEFFRHVGAM